MSLQSPPSLRDLEAAKLEALVEVMFLAAYADGDFGDEEREHFLRSLESLTDRKISLETLGKLVTRIATALEKEGRAARLADVKGRLLDEGSRKTALALAVQLTLADDVIRTSERELILEVAEALEVDRDEAADLVASLSRAHARSK